jgi:hypothetical protein
VSRLPSSPVHDSDCDGDDEGDGGVVMVMVIIVIFVIVVMTINVASLMDEIPQKPRVSFAQFPYSVVRTLLHC